MDSLENIKDELVHIAKLAVTGDTERARAHLLRRARHLRSTDPALAHSYREIATSTDRRPAKAESVVRRAQPAWESADAPSDRDSQLDLLKIEDSPQLPHTPLYDSGTSRILDAIVREHAQPETLRAQGLFPTRTLMLSGPPGVGKTMAARWLAQQSNLPLLTLDLGTVMSRYLGATGTNLKKAFAYAGQRPCVFLLDELDAVAKRRDDNAEIGELKRLVTVLLQEMDNWPEGRLLIAATNHPQLLDPAIWRRFEIRLDLPRPTAEQLSALLPSLLPERATLPRVWREVLPSLLGGTSYSEIEQVLKILRRSVALDSDLTPEAALEPIIEAYISAADRKRRQDIARSLEQLTSLSKRAIASMTRVSRDTLRAKPKPRGGKKK